MVIVSFSSDILNDAQFLGQIGSFEALTEVCSLAVSNIKAGKVSDLKGYAKAAQALNLPVDSLANGVLALSQIYIECAKKNVSVTDFNLSIEDIQISADQRKVLVDTYDAHVKVIREQLAAVSMRLPHYADLDWRLDVEISSRCLRKKIEPTYLLELFTVDALERKNNQLLQCDYKNMQHMVDELEKALKESRSSHSRRILRYVK